jgi:hypothetical protein
MQLFGIDAPGGDTADVLEHAKTTFGGRPKRHNAITGNQFDSETLSPLIPDQPAALGEIDQSRVVVAMPKNA